MGRFQSQVDSSLVPTFRLDQTCPLQVVEYLRKEWFRVPIFSEMSLATMSSSDDEARKESARSAVAIDCGSAGQIGFLPCSLIVQYRRSPIHEA